MAKRIEIRLTGGFFLLPDFFLNMSKITLDRLFHNRGSGLLEAENSSRPRARIGMLRVLNKGDLGS